MRVLHIGKFFPPHPGGIERCVADLCTSLSGRGIAVAALAHAEPGTRGGRFRDPAGFDVQLATCHGQLLYAPLSPGFPFLLARVLREFDPDLLHIHLPNTSALFCLLLPQARRRPWIVHWHADIPLDSQRRLLRAAYALYRPWERAMLRRAAAIIATSAPYRDSSAALAPWLAKTHVIPLGIGPDQGDADAGGTATATARDVVARGASPDATAPGAAAARPADIHPSRSASAPARAVDAGAGSPEAVLRILAVGRLSYFKGIDVLLRAVAQVQTAQLRIVGDGECRAALEQLARELRIASRVRFSGRLDMDAAGDRALRQAYAESDVLVLPSTERAESFGLVLLEAMRAGRPVIASAIPGSGVNYIVRDGQTGLLVPPGDADALADALRRIAGDAALRQRLGANGEQRWRDEFTLDRAAERTLDLYRRLDPSIPHRAAAAPQG